VRRALRRSHTLDLFPPVARPEHLPISGLDAKVQWLCWPAGELMSRHVPPVWTPPYAPCAARVRLLTWCQQVSELIHDSTRGAYSLSLLAKADDDLVDAMQAWLDGSWSTRAALIELLWRLELGERTIGAALWLHRIADDGTGRRRRT
jgi:hypothetical protein